MAGDLRLCVSGTGIKCSRNEQGGSSMLSNESSCAGTFNPKRPNSREELPFPLPEAVVHAAPTPLHASTGSAHRCHEGWEYINLMLSKIEN